MQYNGFTKPVKVSQIFIFTLKMYSAIEISYVILDGISMKFARHCVFFVVSPPKIVLGPRIFSGYSRWGLRPFLPSALGDFTKKFLDSHQKKQYLL